MAEQRLSSQLVCRTYPEQFDSIMGTRLVLLRQREQSLREIVLATTYSLNANPRFSCSLTPTGTIRIWLEDALMPDQAGREVSVAP